MVVAGRYCTAVFVRSVSAQLISTYAVASTQLSFACGSIVKYRMLFQVAHPVRVPTSDSLVCYNIAYSWNKTRRRSAGAFCETWLVTSRRWSDPPEELPDSPAGLQIANCRLQIES